MKRYIKSNFDASEESVYDDCYEEVMNYIIDGMNDGEYYSYDDVVSDVYYGIQKYFEDTHAVLEDSVEDKIYEDVMDMLDTEGYIDHNRGLLLYGN